MPLPFPPDSQQFQSEQRPFHTIEFWNTPFSVLTNDQASGGIVMTVVEPRHSDGAFGVLAAMLGTTDAGAVAPNFAGATASPVITNGRIANLVGYWAGGAPNLHGASVAGQVAYHFECWIRPGSGRDWFDPATTMQAWVGCAGNGYFRVVRNGATNLIDGSMTEEQWLHPDVGGPLTGGAAGTAPTLTVGDKLDIYYVQDRTTWGGFTVKLILGAIPTTVKGRLQAFREGALLGCGIADDSGAAGPIDVTKRTLLLTRDVEVVRQENQPATLTFQVPLANTQSWDGVGWQWVHSGGDEAGYLRMHAFEDDGSGGVTPVTVDVRRQRLIRCKAGFHRWDGADETYTLFTGFIDDFVDPSGGMVTVRCVAAEQRLADQFMKNYPDKISYMTYGYHRLTGTSEPTWDTTAYDNWPLVYCFRDLLARAGIDESRTRAPQVVPQPDGTAVAVAM